MANVENLDSSRRGSSERGAALLIVMLMMAAVASLAIAHLTKVLAEQRRLQVRTWAARAQMLAEGELERAKNIVNAAPYRLGQNTALQAAIVADPPYVPGTTVLVEQMGTSEWFTLRAAGAFQGITKTAQQSVRQGTPVSAYNMFVADHIVGISGAPRGTIQGNRRVDFYFQGGVFQDTVNASEGFGFRAGASRETTQLLGPYNETAAPSNVLDEVSIPALAAKADTLRVVDNLVAEIEFRGTQTQVALFEPQRRELVTRAGIRNVVDHYVQVAYTRRRPVYRIEYYDYLAPVYESRLETYTVSVADYAWRDVTRTRQVAFWVLDPVVVTGGNTGGGEIGGATSAPGHWEYRTESYVEREQYVSGYHSEERSRYVDVQVGTLLEVRSRQVVDYYTDVTYYRDEPVYRQEPYTYQEWVTVPERLVETRTVPTEGLIYIEKDIRKISGTVQGQVSVVSNGKVEVSGSITYVDDQGRTRMNNGAVPDQPYVSNPEYTGAAVLAIMAAGDVTYSRSVPNNFEINASLISVNGRVGFEGIVPTGDGSQVSLVMESGQAASYVKDSIRRLGGIVSRQRPISTYIDEGTHEILCGFRRGGSIMDRNLLMNGSNVTPPFVFNEDRPSWALSVSGRIVRPE